MNVGILVGWQRDFSVRLYRRQRLPDFAAVVVVVGTIHEGCGFAVPLNGFLYHFCHFHNVVILKVKQ